MSGLIGGSIGFGLSIILRLELALPGFILCSSLQYNSNITFHGIFSLISVIHTKNKVLEIEKAVGLMH